MLLERERELRTLREHLHAALKESSGTTVFVGGEAGVGKTALLGELASGCDSRLRPLWAGCEPLLAPRPLGPFSDLAQELGPSLGEAVRDGTPHEVVTCLLSEVRTAGPTLLVLEDLHWADEGTLDAVRLLAHRMQDVPLLVVVSYRDDELGPWHPVRVLIGELGATRTITRMQLAPLSASAVAAMAEPFGADAAALYRRTGGNPFFVTELLPDQTGMPETVADAVLARAARLEPPTREALEAVAVAGPSAERWILNRVLPDAEERLDEAVTAGLLRPSGEEVSFRHELAREAVLSATGGSRRATLHRATLEALRSGSWGEADEVRLAHHAIGAGDPGQILEIVPRAAAQASERGAHREAAVLYEQALRFADALSLEQRATLFGAVSLELFNVAEFETAEVAQRQALACYEQLGDELSRGAAGTWLAQLAWQAGSLPQALNEAEVAVADLQGLPDGDALLALAYCQLAQLLLAAEDPEAAAERSERATAMAAQIDQPEVTVMALLTAGWVEMLTGRRGGLEKLERAAELAEQAGLYPVAVAAEVVIARTAGRLRWWDVADAHLRAGLQLCDGRDFDVWRYYLVSWQAKLALAAGRWDEAAAHAEISLMKNCPFSRIHSLVALGLVRARRGDPDPWVLLDEARASAEPRHELQWIGPVAVARAEARWLEGRPEAIAEELEPALGFPLRPSDPYGAAIAYWGQLGGIEIPLGNGSGQDPYLLQRAGEWKSAAQRWRELGHPYEEAIALAESGEASALRRAHEQLRSLGATPAVAIVSRGLRELGERVPRGPRPDTRANPAGLTAREVDVLALLVEGLRNADIAERLVVSRRTVDHHVSAILRKLEVGSRGEAAAAAQRLGILPE